MAVYEFDAPFALIVNTDQYAGNFEREFCAYVTGAIGECGVGEELAEEFQEEEPASGLFDLTSQVMDDNGCRRPVSIYDDGDKYNSIIIFFDSEPDEDDYAIIVRRAKQFAEERPDWRSYMGTKKPLKLKGMRLIRNEVVRTITTLKQFEI